MFEHESVQIFFGVYMIFSMIVGTVCIVALIGYVIVLPLAKKIINTIKRLAGRREAKYEPLTWSQLHESFDQPTQTILPPVNLINEHGKTVAQLEGLTLETHQGLSYLAGRPIEARNEDTQFMDKITTMHHQM